MSTEGREEREAYIETLLNESTEIVDRLMAKGHGLVAVIDILLIAVTAFHNVPGGGGSHREMIEAKVRALLVGLYQCDHRESSQQKGGRAR